MASVFRRWVERIGAGRMVLPSKQRSDTSRLPIVALSAVAKICSTPRRELAETPDFSARSQPWVERESIILALVGKIVLKTWRGQRGRRAAGLFNRPGVRSLVPRNSGRGTSVVTVFIRAVRSAFSLGFTGLGTIGPAGLGVLGPLVLG